MYAKYFKKFERLTMKTSFTKSRFFILLTEWNKINNNVIVLHR